MKGFQSLSFVRTSLKARRSKGGCNVWSCGRQYPPLHSNGLTQTLSNHGKRNYHVTTSLCSSSDPGQPLKNGSMVLYNTLSEEFESLPVSTENKGLAWYTCGPTTYGPAHLGHARTYVCLDIVRRILEHTSNGTPPLFVMNITNVDDKILAAAAETGEAPLALSSRYEAEFWRDLDALGCLRPHVVTRVTDHVESDIIPYIQQLIDNGMAYVGEDGVYFDVRAYEDKMGHMTKYGKLAPPSASTDFYSRHEGPVSIEGQTKRDARDFVLWKNRKENESLHWPSPWGEGRPGWHIECSAMIDSVQKRFQDSHSFHVHAGGVDLQFPHHTNEICQAEAFYLKDEWIPHWVHTGHLHIHGMKMSKSLKNFITIQEMLEQGSQQPSLLLSPADDFRLWCLGLSGSYRGPATYSADRLEKARLTREKIVRFLLDGEAWVRNQEQQGATRQWNENDKALYDAVVAAQSRFDDAMLGCVSKVEGSPTPFDLNGSTMLDQFLQIVQAGTTHVALGEAGPAEPVRFAVDTLRRLLSLLGFTGATVLIGVETIHKSEKQSVLVGGEEALIEAMVQFRASVRRAAMDDVRNDMATDKMKEILNICDETRKISLPALGLEVFDSKVEDADSSESRNWRFCSPKPVETHESSVVSDGPKPQDIRNIPLENMFRVGPHEGKFSAYDEQGIPTLNADGSEVSKRLRKKLVKKLEKRRRLLEQDDKAS